MTISKTIRRLEERAEYITSQEHDGEDLVTRDCLVEAAGALEKARRQIADKEYFLLAYRNMLGEKGKAVADMWEKKGVQRVHLDWGPGAGSLTGEERAKVILDFEAAICRPVEPGEI